ncbi:MAG TPA: LysM peptidoglycan-binding domain-containing protein, partial [Gemmatimonadales bacterium]|nr:LysM peptidoglycan-binding domain-containing protein [Gemmatimonadales bacterium]
MRRTTICRSDRAVILALAALPLLWRVLPAQDTTQAAQQQDTTQAAAAFQGQVPSSHTVSRGETLWSISQMYFNDPLLWPEIYRLNTAVIEDPHWIYPGEVLNLSEMITVAQGGDTVVTRRDTTQAAQQQDTTQAAAAFQGQVPSSHTVSRGETLWSISQMYFNDPLLWP